MKPNSYYQEKGLTDSINKNRISNITLNALKNTPLDSSQNIPIAQSDHYLCRYGIERRRRYVKAQKVENLAYSKYKGNGQGITFGDLLLNGLALSKKQAQTTLKYYLRREILFTASNCKPQQYFPLCLRSEIQARMSKNIPINPTGVGYCNNRHPPLQGQYYDESITIQTLLGYVLPMLPKAPLFIHNMHFKLKISPECYRELDLPMWKGNYGKHHPDIIGKVRVDYVFYANGTVDIHTQSSGNPHRLETETDRSRLLAFFGQLRDRLVTFLRDKHERLVPEIMDWELTECDINKDIKVSDSLHLCGIKMQVKHLDQLFSIYIKSMGKDTVCRVEERKSLKHTLAIESINRIFNPFEAIENHSSLEKKLDQILLEIEELSLPRLLGYFYRGGFAVY